MQRFRFVHAGGPLSAAMGAAVDGEWVHWDDHEAEVERLRSELANQREIAASWLNKCHDAMRALGIAPHEDLTAAVASEREARESAEAELDSLLVDWTAITKAIGSRTNGTAIATATALRARLEQVEEERDELRAKFEAAEARLDEQVKVADWCHAVLLIFDQHTAKWRKRAAYCAQVAESDAEARRARVTPASMEEHLNLVGRIDGAEQIREAIHGLPGWSGEEGPTGALTQQVRDLERVLAEVQADRDDDSTESEWVDAATKAVNEKVAAARSEGERVGEERGFKRAQAIAESHIHEDDSGFARVIAEGISELHLSTKEEDGHAR